MRSFGLTLLLSVNADFYGTRRITKRAGDDTYGIFTPGVRTNGQFFAIITFLKSFYDFYELDGSVTRFLIKMASTIVSVVAQFRVWLI